MGMQTMRMASAEKMQLGDSVDVEAGGTVYAIQTAGTALTAQPFLNVTVHPGEVWAVRYRLATSRDVQDFDGLDSIAAELPVAVDVRRAALHRERHAPGDCAEPEGRRRTASGSRVPRCDRADSIAGTGAMGAAELAGSGGASGVVVDTETGSFRALGAGITANGVSLTLSEPLTGGPVGGAGVCERRGVGDRRWARAGGAAYRHRPRRRRWP